MDTWNQAGPRSRTKGIFSHTYMRISDNLNYNSFYVKKSQVYFTLAAEPLEYLSWIEQVPAGDRGGRAV